MSYILDALKKAESERKSGTAPTLRLDQPSLPTAAVDEQSIRRTAWLRVGFTAIAAILLGLIWIKFWRGATPAVVPANAPPAIVTAQPAEPQLVKTAEPVPPVATASMPEAQPRKTVEQLPPAAAAPATPAAPVTRPAVPSTPQPAAADEEPPVKPQKPKPKPATAEKKPAKTTAPVESKPSEASPASESRVAAVRELPAHIQNELPSLKVSGYIYSQKKADRTVLINNRLMREGDQVTPDLKLEALTPSGMVLNYKGYRYRTSY
jgi:general secretion pathway protein B